MIIRLLKNNKKQMQELRKPIHDMNENFSHEIEFVKRNIKNEEYAK